MDFSVTKIAEVLASIVLDIAFTLFDPHDMRSTWKLSFSAFSAKVRH